MAKDIVAQWLKNYVGPTRFCDAFWGDYDFPNEKMNQNVGAVYGIWMKASEDELLEYTHQYGKSLNSFNGYIPVYWGKDVSPCHRLAAHFKTPKSTGGLNLIKSTYTGRELIFGCILTKEYATIEKRLHDEYPALAGSDRAGKSSNKRKILE